MTERTARRIRATIAACLLLAGPAYAADGDFVGKWRLTIQAPGVVPYVAQLDIEEHDGSVRAWVENGPTPVETNGEQIVLRIDARDRQGFRFERVLEGSLDNDRMAGTVAAEGILETAAEYGEQVGLPVEVSEES